MAIVAAVVAAAVAAVAGEWGGHVCERGEELGVGLNLNLILHLFALIQDQDGYGCPAEPKTAPNWH